MSLPICDGYIAAGVINKAGLMQHACRQCYRGSRRAQHLAEKLVGKRHVVGLHPIVTGEKPSGQAFTDGVQPVTRRVLCTLNQIREQVFLQMASQLAIPLEFTLQTLCFDSKT